MKKPCEYCEQEFEARRSRYRFCCPDCYGRWLSEHSARMREEPKEPAPPPPVPDVLAEITGLLAWERWIADQSVLGLYAHRRIKHYPVAKEWIDMAEAAVIYGVAVQGYPEAGSHWKEIARVAFTEGWLPSTCTVCQRYVILKRDEVEKLARHVQENRASKQGILAVTREYVTPDPEETARRIRELEAEAAALRESPKPFTRVRARQRRSSGSG